MDGFSAAKPATLVKIRANLLDGLTLVAEEFEAGRFHEIGEKGSAPPSQSGQLTLILLAGVEREIERRSAA